MNDDSKVSNDSEKKHLAEEQECTSTRVITKSPSTDSESECEGDGLVNRKVCNFLYLNLLNTCETRHIVYVQNIIQFTLYSTAHMSYFAVIFIISCCPIVILK